MSPNEDSARERIFAATVALLTEARDPGSVTVRQIADRAGVGTGLINYHFQSKESLFSEVVSALLVDEAQKHFRQAADGDDDPRTRLRALFKATSQVGARYHRLVQLMIAYGFQQGDVSVPVMIMPLLREIFGPAADDLKLRLIALQIALPIQFIALNPAALRQYTGYDLLDDQQRDRLIDQIIDNVIPNVIPPRGTSS
jgi:AcrR family transcriptional regulator